MQRRGFLAGGATLAMAAIIPSGALGAERAQRRFRVLRDGDDIGIHTLSATLDDRGFTMEIKIEIAVKILGITAYRYNLLNRERWRNGRIVEVDSRVFDDGVDDFCKIVQQDGELAISGSRFTGKAPIDAVTTSYYHPDFIGRRPWISTQSGAILDIQIEEVAPRVHQVTGELTTRLTYDDRGEWVNVNFDAGGDPGTYELISETGLISPLWSEA
ncbi:MAG: DUF6134 family protein [Pseudomonadota bacterium]